jgi:DNA-directed RNA polymerase specialized sigma24 family protein
MCARRHQPIPSPNARVLAALLAHHYPRTYRITVSLCGDRFIAHTVTRQVLLQGLRVHDQWETESDVGRWFAHHTVLLARQSLAGRVPDAAADELLTLTTDPVFLTILRTIRFLPPQQREAFLLHHGEQFDLRQLATAMDCSSEAAANHLIAATQALRPVAADRLGDFTAQLPQLLQRLLPPPQTIAVESQRVAKRYIWPQRLRRWVGWPLTLIALAWLLYLGWRLWQIVVI